MTDVDVSKIKVGDVVGVRVVRTSADLNYVTVAAAQAGASNVINRSAIVSHTPAPRPALKVGDRVRVPHIPAELSVIWIARGKAWLEPSANHAPYYPLSEVEQWERV